MKEAMLVIDDSAAARRRAPLLALALALAIAGLVALTAAPSALAKFDPHDFDVRVEMAPEIENSEPECTSDGDRMRCTSAFEFSQIGKSFEGTVRHRVTDLSGTISMTCDQDMRQRTTFSMSTSDPSDRRIEEFDGAGRMACSWMMDFREGTTLAGVVEGSFTMGIVDAARGIVYHRGNFSVDVVSGTGEFADMVGKGTFDEYEEFNMLEGPGGGPDGPPPPDGEGPPPPDGEYSTRSAARAAAEEGDGGNMKLRLRRGRARTALVLPRRLDRGDKRALRVASARGSTCRGVASKGKRRVDLGKARDSSGNGEVRFRGSLARKLGKGSWKVRVKCSYRSKGKVKRAVPAARKVRIA